MNALSKSAIDFYLKDFPVRVVRTNSVFTVKSIQFPDVKDGEAYSLGGAIDQLKRYVILEKGLYILYTA